MLSRRLKAMSDGDVMTSDGRALQTRGAAETAIARSPTLIGSDPSVERATRASKRNGVDDDSPCLPHGTVGVQRCQVGLGGAMPCRQRKTSTAIQIDTGVAVAWSVRVQYRIKVGAIDLAT